MNNLYVCMNIHMQKLRNSQDIQDMYYTSKKHIFEKSEFQTWQKSKKL